MVTVGELKNYIQENLVDGTLKDDDVVYVGDCYDRFFVQALFNDVHELIISLIKSKN